MHNFSTTSTQVEPVLSNNMAIIETAYNSEAYHRWFSAAEMEDAGDTASPTYRAGVLATGVPAHWRMADAVNSSVCFYLRRHDEWKDGVLSLVPHYSTSAVDGDIRWRITITTFLDSTSSTPTVVGFTTSPPSAINVITTDELTSSDLAKWSKIDTSHIGVMVTVGRQGGGAEDTNTGVLWLYGVDLVYKELRRVVGGKG